MKDYSGEEDKLFLFVQEGELDRLKSLSILMIAIREVFLEVMWGTNYLFILN